ncbi:putative PhoH-like protein PhoH2 (phosphate starvation-inducible protein PsiH) [Actinoplanes sp. NBRC 14428]|uniref:PhoH-like ATPase n=1 Tax=Pseudosporangium ferrugineum TaxID=439699 RepID=A0A2T0S4G8_9ACTN|nr:PhoH family protein [Pseudosporangium ferrugineum]PRY28318.1 PhoH-like ATPase [Pseudosporangium ferrugineum]BCJ54053.1 putative PhoH-like protein PhoH2 (phosphate starvation-inducible protein PsiH) [Actinoplanes sp. NBRC 14428]
MTSRRTDAGAAHTDPAAKVSSSRASSGRRASRDRHADAEPAPAGRVFVLDTSVLLSDPAAFRRFTDHEVIIPLVVISELEGKRHHPELGWFARQALRMLDELRIKHGRLDHPVLCNDEGGTVRVELNHADQSVLPLGFRNDSNDTRILSVALGLTAEGRDVTLVSKDMPLRVKAASVGLTADEYLHGQASDPTWTGMAELELNDDDVNRLYAGDELQLEETGHLPCHTGLVVHSSRGSALARVNPDQTVKLVRGDREAFGLRGRSAEQRVALDILLDESIGIVSLGGRAGTGKSALALCAGLEATMERNRHKKVVVFRPLYAVGGQELGYLPGSESEKMSPWAQAVFDTLGAVVHANVMEEVLARGMLEVLPLTHIRGRSLHDAFVIVDEAQSLERNVLLTVLSRIGQGSRVVLTHDVAQRDNLRVGRHDGVTAVIEALKGHPIFAHVTLTRSERSPIAEVVTDLLEEIPL